MKLRIILAFLCITVALGCTGVMLYGIFALHGDAHTLATDGGGLGGTLFLWLGNKVKPK